MDGEPSQTATVPPEDSGVNGPERTIRRVSLGLIILVVVLASSGLLGVRTDVARAAGSGLTLSVLHSSVARAGLAAPFSVEVATDDGSDLPQMVTIRVDSAYLAMFDDNGMEPLPSTSFNTSRWTWWEFEVAPGQDSLRVDLDARLEPAVQWGRQASAAVEIDGVEVIRTEFRTSVMP
jgi:hypothetical protein